jgi:hypothetical protein
VYAMCRPVRVMRTHIDASHNKRDRASTVPPRFK